MGYGKVAYLDDLYSLSQRKKAVRVSTTSSTEIAGYTYTPANEPSGAVWTGVAVAPTFDGVTLADQDRVLIQDAIDKRGNGIFYYDDATNSLKRTLDADDEPGLEEVASCMVPVTEGTLRKNTLRREINTPPLVVGTDDIEFTPFILNIPMEDQYVKVSATDTTEKYLLDCVNNAVVSSGPATNNTNVIKVIHVDQ